MVLRALLSICFLVASVLSPGFCCCVARALAQGGTSFVSPAPAPAAKTGCPHGRRADPPPADPGGDRCRCQDHVVTSSAPDPVTLPAAQLSDWLASLPPFVFAPFVQQTLGVGSPLQADWGSPPPPAGVELLHRIHVLIC